MVRTWAQSNPFQPHSYQICEGYVWVLPVQVPVHSKPYSALLVGLGMGQREVWDCHCRQCEALHLSKSRSGQCPRRDILASHFRTGRQWEAGLSSHPCSKWALLTSGSMARTWTTRPFCTGHQCPSEAAGRKNSSWAVGRGKLFLCIFPGFGWGRVNFLPRNWYSAGFWV